MTLPAVLLPVFVQVLLTFVLMMIMAGRRLGAVRGRAVRREDVILGQRNWPPRAQAASNAFSNQFELPVLFYVLVVLAIVTRKADLLFVVLSWVFVASRIVQAVAYVTTNVVPFRFTAYLVGAVALVIMWVVFAVRILATPLAA